LWKETGENLTRRIIIEVTVTEEDDKADPNRPFKLTSEKEHIVCGESRVFLVSDGYNAANLHSAMNDFTTSNEIK
jgi:hypothetical protein